MKIVLLFILANHEALNFKLCITNFKLYITKLQCTSRAVKPWIWIADVNTIKHFWPCRRYFTFLCNETTSKFILKQLDYSPSCAYFKIHRFDKLNIICLRFNICPKPKCVYLAATACIGSDRVVFKWVSKVITWLRSLHLKDSSQIFNQWEENQNQSHHVQVIFPALWACYR